MAQRSISATEFKAKCLALLDDVAKKRETLVVTKRGKPVAQLAPVVQKAKTLRGFLKGSIKSGKDIVRPVAVRWDAARS